MARDKAYPTMPITVRYLSKGKAKKKTFKNTNIDEVVDQLQKGTLWGVPKDAEIIRLGVGTRFM
jgi:hypothetical protein